MSTTYRIVTPAFDADRDEIPEYYGLGYDEGIRHYPTARGTFVHTREQAYSLRRYLVNRWKEEYGLEDAEVPRYMIVRE